MPEISANSSLTAGYTIEWIIVDGGGSIDHPDKEFIEFTAPKDPGIVTLEAIIYRIIKNAGQNV